MPSKVLLTKWLVNEGMSVPYPGQNVSVLFDEKLSDGICIILHLKSLSSLIKYTLPLPCCWSPTLSVSENSLLKYEKTTDVLKLSLKVQINKSEVGPRHLYFFLSFKVFF